MGAHYPAAEPNFFVHKTVKTRYYAPTMLLQYLAKLYKVDYTKRELWINFEPKMRHILLF